MPVSLRVNELLLFEERAGVTFARAAKRMAPKWCQVHRLAMGACKDCKKSAPNPCDPHAAAIAECDDCEGPDTPMAWIAALGWIYRRRREPDLTWERFIETAEVNEVMAELGNP